ncbi:unnamed protein product [Arctogadus glacialis]
MSYYMDSVSAYPHLHPCDRLGAMQRQSGGVAAGLQTHFPGAVHPQKPGCPSQPTYPQDVSCQEVPNGHELCLTGWDARHRGGAGWLLERGGGEGSSFLPSPPQAGCRGARPGSKGRSSLSQACGRVSGEMRECVRAQSCG